MSNKKEILVVYKKSSLQLAKDYNNKHILKLIDKKDKSVYDYAPADYRHKKCLKHLKKIIKAEKTIIADFKYNIEDIDMHKYNLVVTVGGDGTFLWTSHFLSNKTTIVGVNSDPKTSFGFFANVLGNSKKNLTGLVEKIVHMNFTTIETPRISVLVNGKLVTERVLNDVLFAAEHPAEVTKYIINKTGNNNCNNLAEEQKSSGIWFSTPAGSTGANLSAGGSVRTLESTKCSYIVRELIKHINERDERDERDEYKYIHGGFGSNEAIEITCKTRRAILSCDGSDITFPVTTGDHITIKKSHCPLTLAAPFHKEE